jgi:hypothetical protein
VDRFRHNPKFWLTFLFAISGLEALLAVYFLFVHPSEPGNRILLGFSSSRLILLGGMLLLAIGLFYAAWRAWRKADWAASLWNTIFGSAKTLRMLPVLFGFLFLLTTLYWLLPAYRYNRWWYYAERLRPVLGWLTLFSLQALFGLFYFGKILHPEKLAPARRVMLFSTLILAGMLGLWAALSWVRFKSASGVSFSREAGVPLLAGQVWLIGVLAAGGTGLYMWAVRRRGTRGASTRRKLSHPDLLIGLFLWLVTAVLWIRAPLPPSFFALEPYPPSYEYYPYSDAATWDAGGQLLLVGQGIANRDAFADHAGLMGFLAMLHLLVGQEYLKVVAAQTAVLAVFPAILYALGKTMHSRLAGLVVAGLAVLHGLNAVAASNLINQSNFKFLLTEFPLAVGLALLIFWLFQWLRDVRRNLFYVLPIGGLLGLLLLLRFNILLIIVVIPLLAAPFYWRAWKSWLKAVSLFALALILTLSPWMGRSWILTGTPLFFSQKASLIFQTQFRNPQPAPDPTPVPVSDQDASARMAWQEWGLAQPVQRLPGVASIKLASLPLANRVSPIVDPTTNVTPDSQFGLGLRQTNAGLVQGNNWGATLSLIAFHFANNLITSTLILPTSPAFHDLAHTIREVSPFWRDWQGGMSAGAKVMLFFDLLLLSVGLGVSWQKWRLAGLIPLALFLGYNMATALARTSGGRYIVPVDWVVFFYFALGLVQLCLWGLAWLGMAPDSYPAWFAPVSDAIRLPLKTGLLMLLPFILFVAALPVLEGAIPQRYPDLSSGQVVEKLEEDEKLKRQLQQVGISAQDLKRFLKRKRAVALSGRALYPRFYNDTQGEHSASRDVFTAKPYPRLAFWIIGPYQTRFTNVPGIEQALLPLSASPDYFPNASDVVVIGCRHTNPRYIDAALVVVLGQQPKVYLRQPSAPLTCPLPEPVCDNNQVCQ